MLALEPKWLRTAVARVLRCSIALPEFTQTLHKKRLSAGQSDDLQSKKICRPTRSACRSPSFPSIFRTFLLSNLIFLTLRARGQVYLPPSPSLASARLVPFGVGRLRGMFFLICGTNFWPIKKHQNVTFFQNVPTSSKTRPDAPSFWTSLIGIKNQ